nr:winged helix-turn-helix domain-containing protein [Methanohalophilus levihalophilus]
MFRGVVAIKRRNRIDISADILETAKNGANKTQIVYNTNLNFSIAKKYLEMLEEKELIRQEGNLYITTEKGKTFHDLAMLLKL